MIFFLLLNFDFYSNYVKQYAKKPIFTYKDHEKQMMVMNNSNNERSPNFIPDI